MAYFRCGSIGVGGGKNLDGLTIKNSGASVPTAHQEYGWSGTSTGSGSITIQFPESIDLSQYNVSGGTVNGNSITAGYTIKMTGSAGYYNASCTGNNIVISKK